MNRRTEQPTEVPEQSVTSIDVTILSTLFDSAPDVAFFVKDEKGCYVTVNNSLVKRHGLNKKSEVIGKRPRDICQGDFGQVPSQQDEKILKTGQPLVEHLEMQWNRSQESTWCLTTKLPILDEDKNIIGIVGFSRDVRIPVQREDIPSGFAKALEEFERSLSDTCTPSWLAEQSDMTPQKLLRFCKRVFGLTPTQLITRIRIATASQLLRDTEKSVSDVAMSCGFYDHSAFTRSFRNATGLTPSQFRAQE